MRNNFDIKRLKECREAIGITRQEAAKIIGVSQPAYVRYENGTRTPSIQVINELARVFNTSAAYLTGQTDISSPDFIIIAKENSLLYSVVDCCRQCDEGQLKRLAAYLEKIKSTKK